MFRRHSGVSSLAQTKDRITRDRVRKQRATARKVNRLKRRCRKQVQILKGLESWATRYNMWLNDFDDPRHYIALASISNGRYHHYYVRYYEDGRIAVRWENGHSGNAASGLWWTDSQVQLWSWLRGTSTEDLLDAANRAAYNRGAGSHTLI